MNNETYNLIEDFPEFADLINSKQFEYAQKLIQIRLSSGLGFKEMADIVGYTPEEYLSFEYGEQNINIEEYEEVIRKLEMHINPEEIEKHERKDTYQVHLSETYKKSNSKESKQFYIQNLGWVA
ncbi:helix-turn-helix domain-containing protein [Ruoffia tabacinasalis]|uniref:helix-turn-helix domain-containing protein n=1 Tax=Ruoffia tabacinasalis TaxID=87458 RepID=UPI003F9CFDA8